MKVSPLTLGTIHFIGIGGIGMSGIAEILHALGQKVQGSDSTENANVKRLAAKGIQIFIGQEGKNINKANLVVISTAIKPDNPELLEAQKQGLVIIHRSEMLAQIARLKFSAVIAGSHGKTTTTSLISRIFDTALMDPTVINGGIITAYGTNARLGSGDWIVLESDESDGSFLGLSPTVAVVTNIDPEHLDYYKDFETLKDAFSSFLSKIPFYGFGVVCIDHPVVKEIVSKLDNKTLVTYGFSDEAMVRGLNTRVVNRKTLFDVEISLPQKPQIVWKDVEISMVGDHNVLNTLAALAVAHKLEIPRPLIQEGLAEFEGVKRRFTHVDTVQDVSIYDDYAHHPVEITAVLKAARKVTKGRVFAVAQPHRYTRVRDLIDDFATSLTLADHVFLAPIYTAGEDPIPGVTSATMLEKMKARGGSGELIENSTHIAPLIHQKAKAGDAVIFMGAGTVTQWAYALPQELEQLRASHKHSPAA